MRTWTVPDNIDDHPRIRWYVERAEGEGDRVADIMRAADCGMCDESLATLGYDRAREAGHWAGLVLGYREQAGQTLCVFGLDVRVANRTV
jgi:hypothetical protein